MNTLLLCIVYLTIAGGMIYASYWKLRQKIRSIPEKFFEYDQFLSSVKPKKDVLFKYAVAFPDSRLEPIQAEKTFKLSKRPFPGQRVHDYGDNSLIEYKEGIYHSLINPLDYRKKMGGDRPWINFGITSVEDSLNGEITVNSDMIYPSTTSEKLRKSHMDDLAFNGWELSIKKTADHNRIPLV